MFVMPCAIVDLLSLFLSLLCFGLLVRTRSKPYGLHHCPYTLAHIKGFGSPIFHVYACLLLCFMLVLASLVLASLVAHEGLFGCNHLGGIAMMPISSCIPFPFSTICDDMLTMLVYTTHRLYLHLYMLAYMSTHESCLLVCCPCFNTMKSWTFDPNLHLSLVGATFLCVLLLVCLFVCLLEFLLCLPCLSCLSTLCLFHTFFAPFLSIACLMVSCLCLCMYTYGVRMLGVRA